jgi:tetratricopeptide (TPR) repeat protein
VSAESDFDDLWDYEQPAATEAAFRALLPQAESGPNRSYHLQLLTQIARTQGLQRKFDDAHTTLDHVETQLSDDQLVARVRYFLERGRVFNSSGHPDPARPLFQHAWDLSRSEPDAAFFAVDAAHMLAVAAEGVEDGIAWNTAALERAEAASDERARGWCGSLYNNLGWTHHDNGQFEDALRYFQRAVHWREQHGTTRQVRVARWPVGRTLRSLGRLDDALSLQTALLGEWEQSGEQQAGYVSEEIAECLYALGRVEESRPHFTEAHTLLTQDPWLVAQEPDRLRRLQRLSR